MYIEQKCDLAILISLVARILRGDHQYFQVWGPFWNNLIDFTLTILREQPHLGINILVYLKQSLCL